MEEEEGEIIGGVVRFSSTAVSELDIEFYAICCRKQQIQITNSLFKKHREMYYNRFYELWTLFTCAGFWDIDKGCSECSGDHHSNAKPEICFTAYHIIKQIFMEGQGGKIRWDTTKFQPYCIAAYKLAIKIHLSSKHQLKKTWTGQEKAIEIELLTFLNHEFPRLNLYDHMQICIVNSHYNPFPGSWKQFATFLIQYSFLSEDFILLHPTQIAFCCFIISGDFLGMARPMHADFFALYDAVFPYTSNADFDHRLNQTKKSLKRIPTGHARRLIDQNPGYSSTDFQRIMLAFLET